MINSNPPNGSAPVSARTGTRLIHIYPAIIAMNRERLCLPPHSPNPIEASSLALGAFAVGGCVNVGVIVL